MVLMYTPIDLPAMDVNRDEFIAWHESKRKRNKRDIGYNNLGFIPPWLVSFAYHKDFGWCNRFLKAIPNFQDIVDNHLPYTHLDRIIFLEQKIHCLLHKDVGSRPDEEDEPGSYKAMMVYDKPLMYFQKELEGEDRVYIKHPNELTKWFAINNYDAHHASDLPTAPDRKIIMTIVGKLDKEKHHKILSRSLEKYKDYTISF